MDVLSDRKLGKLHSKPLHLLYYFSVTKVIPNQKRLFKKKSERTEEFGFPSALRMAELTSARTHPRDLIT